MSNHTIIATVGCAGSSLLMAILTKLGIDTGHDYHPPRAELHGIDSFGGMYETPLSGRRGQAQHDKGFPYVIKSSRMCRTLHERAERWDLEIDHVFCLMRAPTFYASAKDRTLRNNQYGHAHVTDTRVLGREQKLQKNFLALCLNLANSDIPHTMLAYPNYLVDLPLTYKKLKPLMDRYSVSYEQFKDVCDELVDDKLLREALKYEEKF